MAEPDGQRTYRQRSAILTGSLALIACALFTAVAIADGSWGWALVIAGIGAIIASLTVLPSVVLASDGVQLRNIVRRVRFTWPAIDLIESRWNLKIVTPQGRAYGSWAIASQRSARRGAAQSVSSSGLGPRLLLGRRDAVPTLVDRVGSAADVATRIRSAQQEYEQLAEQGRVATQQPLVTVEPERFGLVLVVAGVLAVLVGGLLVWL